MSLMKRLLPILVVILIVAIVSLLLVSLKSNPWPASNSVDSVKNYFLPDDICRIDGKAVMPQINYMAHYGINDDPMIMTYVDSKGNLVTINNGKTVGLILGDFCHKDILTYER